MTRQSELTFSIWKMYVKNPNRGEIWILPTKEFFSTAIKDYQRKNSRFYKIDKDEDEDDTYTYLVLNSGDIEPRDDYVTDVNSNERRENPRKETEVELTKQIFIYYDHSTDLLYISGVRHKNLFKDILNLKSEEEVLIKGVYEGKDSFMKLIKSVEEISFKSESNIFESLSDKRQTLYDLFETSELDDFTLNLGLNSIKIAEIKNFIRTMFKEQENQNVTALMIRGKDESDFEYVYNSDSFIKKITVSSPRLDNKKFDNKSILEALQNKIMEISSDEKTKQR